jgi:hypothetical protein
VDRHPCARILLLGVAIVHERFEELRLEARPVAEQLKVTVRDTLPE